MISALPAWAFAPPTQLDPYQEAVANDTQGVMLIAAAAGSGKTRTAVERTLRLMRAGVPPEAILMLAFNVNAVDTMRARIGASCPTGVDRAHVYTFHSWCYRLLRYWFPQEPRLNRIIGTPQGPARAKIARDTLKGIGGKVDRVYEYIDICGLAAEALLDVRRFDAAQAAQKTLGCFSDEKSAHDWVRFAQAYQAAKIRHGAIDFSDMLLEVGLWITGAPDAPHVAALRNSYLHVVVDECQDMSPARWAVAAHLGALAYEKPEERSLAFFGDARQGINGFAGAKIDILLELNRDERVKKYVLPTNFRSTQRIVDRANEISAGQEWNLGGATLPHAAAASGEAVQVWYTSSEEEGQSVVRDVQRRLVQIGWTAPSGNPNFLVLARTTAVLYRLEHAFISQGVPCRIVGEEGGLWGSLTGKQFLAYLETAEGRVNYGLLDVSNRPRRFAKKEAVVQALQDADRLNKVAFDPARIAQQLNISLCKGAQRLGHDIELLASQPWAERVMQVAQMLRRALNDQPAAAGRDVADNDAEAAIMVVAESAIALGSLEGIDEEKRLQARLEIEARNGCVVLSTIHRQKGQEGTVCYLVGCADGILPHKKCYEALDEERRLFYVAATRAVEVLIVSTGTTASQRKPSRFLAECWGEDIGHSFANETAQAASKPRSTTRTRKAQPPKDPVRR